MPKFDFNSIIEAGQKHVDKAKAEVQAVIDEANALVDAAVAGELDVGELDVGSLVNNGMDAASGAASLVG